MKLLSKVTSIFDSTIDFLALSAAVLMIFIMLCIVADVVMRYVLSRPIFWVVEIAEYSLLWITFLGAAWLLKREGHVKMDLLINRLRPENQALLNTITSFMGAIIFLVIAWYSATVTSDLWQSGYFVSSLNLRAPKGPILAIIPAGSVLLSVQFLRRTYSYLGNFRGYFQIRNRGRR